MADHNDINSPNSRSGTSSLLPNFRNVNNAKTFSPKKRAAGTAVILPPIQKSPCSTPNSTRAQGLTPLASSGNHVGTRNKYSRCTSHDQNVYRPLLLSSPSAQQRKSSKRRKTKDLGKTLGKGEKKKFEILPLKPKFHSAALCPLENPDPNISLRRKLTFQDEIDDKFEAALKNVVRAGDDFSKSVEFWEQSLQLAEKFRSESLAYIDTSSETKKRELVSEFKSRVTNSKAAQHRMEEMEFEMNVANERLDRIKEARKGRMNGKNKIAQFHDITKGLD